MSKSPFIFKFLPYLPFHFIWLTRRLVGNPKTVLDLGCGKGELMGFVKGNRDWVVTGVDIYKKSLNQAEKTGVYKELINGDLILICQKMIKKRRSFDLVFASGIIEHITRSDGEKLLDLIEKLVKKRIFIGTPRDYMKQPDNYMLGNPFQRHKSGWSVKDFSERGYKVYGAGISLLWTEKGLARSNNIVLIFLASVVSYILSPVVFFVPSMASGIMAVKTNSKKT